MTPPEPASRAPRQFEGKVALVTGAGSGIGRASALALAREGASVILGDVDVEGGLETVRAIERAGGNSIFVSTDVSKAAQVETLVGTALEAYGRLDFAHNNAGVNIERGPLAECTESEWDLVMGVNLKGIWLCMKYEIPVMLRTGGGAIVNTASILGMRAGRGVPAYTASKHGVVGLTRAAALDYGRSGLRINAVCPGPIRTAMYHRREGTDPATEARFAEAIPLGRMGSAADVAAAVVWLCSDASSFITGHALTMDGGGRL